MLEKIALDKWCHRMSVKKPGEDINCVGSACMAWRDLPPIKTGKRVACKHCKKEREAAKPEAGEKIEVWCDMCEGTGTYVEMQRAGFCGLAGKATEWGE